MVLIYEDVVLQLDAVVFLRLHLPPFYGEGAIYCPRRLRKKDLVAQLGLQIPCHRTGSECVCYVNSIEPHEWSRCGSRGWGCHLVPSCLSRYGA